MSVEYEAFGVIALIYNSKEDLLLIKNRAFPFSLAKKGETAQRAFKRLVYQSIGREISTFESLSYLERRSVKEFPYFWAPGLKTIPIYAFLTKIDETLLDKEAISIDEAKKLGSKERVLMDLATERIKK